MDWTLLLSGRRLGPGSGSEPPPRTRFQRDYDRIIFSTPFRRMHGKTQVFPLPSSDLTHTRLSHSLEAACVARSLGALIDIHLGSKGFDSTDCAGVLAAAALAHDIGNPPFGHSGEDAIAHFFQTDGRNFTKGLTEAQVTDLERFEGNALGFRLLADTNPRRSSWTGGLGLTMATLATFTKYPRGSRPAGNRDKASERKFGYFQGEKQLFENVATVVGLIDKGNGVYARHPLAFLLEAADDICYRIIDLEDAYRLNIIPYDAAFLLLGAIASAAPDPTNEVTLGGLRDYDDRIGYLRAKAINNLVHQVADAFVARHDPIVAGAFDEPLVGHIPSGSDLVAIKRVCEEEVFPHRPVVEIEAAGFRVLGGLLDDLLGHSWEHPRSRRAEKVLSLLPQDVGPDADEQTSDAYGVLIRITQYVAGMTDEFAIRTYRTLRGIELPTS